MDYVNPQTDPGPVGVRFREYQDKLRHEGAQSEGDPMLAYAAFLHNPNLSPDEVAAKVKVATDGFTPEEASEKANAILMQYVRSGMTVTAGIPDSTAGVLANHEARLAALEGKGAPSPILHAKPALDGAGVKKVSK